MAKKLLIIDDAEDIRQVLKAVLEIHGFEILEANDGRTGMEKFRQNKELLSIVLLDVMLPDIDGYQILQAMRTESRVPVIMLTAKDRNTDKILGLEFGADDYVVKPFDTLELLARIKAVLRRYEDANKEKKTFENTGPLEIDEEKRTVKINNKTITFTHTEFELFKYLYQRRDQVVTRKEIKDALWSDKDIYQWSRTIDVHISHIREKIEDNPAEPKILLTIPQRGYKLKI